MSTFLKLIRYQNLLMVLVTLVLTQYFLINSFTFSTQITTIQFCFLAISILCVTAGGYIINDIYDIDIDLINKPQKVFIKNGISTKKAWSLYLLFNLIGLFIAFIHFLNLFFIFFIASFLLWLYSKYLKGIALVGNIVVSFLIALTIFILARANELSICGNLDSITNKKLDLESIIIIMYCVFSFMITLIREVIKDIEDINGDYALQLKTLPIIIGRKRTQTFVLILSSIFFVFLVFVLKSIYSFPYFFWYGILCVVIPFGWFMYKLRISKTTKHFHQLSQVLKIIMCLGILSMLLFKFL